jgi:hypothetical protein
MCVPLADRVIEAISQSSDACMRIAGRLILVDSPPLRRRLRGFASGRRAVTDADCLIVGLAYRRPDFSINSADSPAGQDRQHRSRLERTLGAEDSRETWAILHATRLMTVVEKAVRDAGGHAEWVTEGLDMPRIAEILAVPDDHLVLGMIAASLNAVAQPPAQSPVVSEPMMDRNGFGGGWPANGPASGEGGTVQL